MSALFVGIGSGAALGKSNVKQGIRVVIDYVVELGQPTVGSILFSAVSQDSLSFTKELTSPGV